MLDKFIFCNWNENVFRTQDMRCRNWCYSYYTSQYKTLSVCRYKTQNSTLAGIHGIHKHKGVYAFKARPYKWLSPSSCRSLPPLKKKKKTASFCRDEASFEVQKKKTLKQKEDWVFWNDCESHGKQSAPYGVSRSLINQRSAPSQKTRRLCIEERNRHRVEPETTSTSSGRLLERDWVWCTSTQS